MTCPDPSTISGPVGAQLSIPTPDEPTGGEVVHPSVVRVPGGWNGFEYWMAFTPFPGSDNSKEDPCIVASNDGIVWEVPAGLTNPIDDQPGLPGAFNSDVDLKKVGDTMYVFWRTFDPAVVGGEEHLYYSTSTDGTTWAAKTLFFQSDTTVVKLLSPTLWFDSDLSQWTMWAVDIIPDPREVVRRISTGSTPESGWGAPDTVSIDALPADRQPWHLFIDRLEGCYVGLLDHTAGKNNADHQMAMITSVAGLSFNSSGSNVVVPQVQAGEHDNLYRGCLIVNPDGDGYRVWYSAFLDGSPRRWRIYRTLIQATVEPGPGPEPEPGVPQVAQAVIRTRLTWLSCNLSDGAVITELPDLQGDEVSRVIGDYTSANLELPIPAVGGRDPDITLAERAALAIQSTQPPRTKIVAVVNDVPAWEGIPLPRDLGTDATIPLGCVSMEGYLRHVYITDHTFDGVDVSVIAAGLLGDAVTTPHGPGVALVIDAPTVGVTASRSYLDIDDQTVYAGLSELMDAGLIEWTLSPDWRIGFPYRIVDTIARVRGRLGKIGDPQAVFQSATFSSQGASDARYALKQDYSGDRYANVVRLTGTGEGVDQPRSAPAIDQQQLDSGVPVWELRDSAPQTISGQADLDRHATQRLDRVSDGAQVIEVTARWDAPGARYGVDWQMGDDVKLELKGHAHPSGLNVVRRAIGFHLSIQAGTIRPVLQEEF